eukprot:1389899-Pyramimonas_sp.AAC.1
MGSVGGEKPRTYGKHAWGILSFVCIYLCFLGPLHREIWSGLGALSGALKGICCRPFRGSPWAAVELS